MILALPSDYFKGKEVEKITTQTTRTLKRNRQFRGYLTISQKAENITTQTTRTLGSLVRIALEAWMSVPCVGSGFATG
jgi:hypothetical protein